MRMGTTTTKSMVVITSRTIIISIKSSAFLTSIRARNMRTSSTAIIPNFNAMIMAG